MKNILVFVCGCVCDRLEQATQVVSHRALSERSLTAKTLAEVTISVADRSCEESQLSANWLHLV